MKMNTNALLRWGIIGGILLVFFVPLFVANTLYFPFITGKGFAFRILIEIVFALWLILILRDPSARPKKSLLLYLVGAFLLSIGISVIFSANPDKSFWSNFERMEGWIGIAHLAAYFTVLFSTFASEKPWKILWNTTIGVSVLEACYGILQLMGVFPINQGGVRVDGTFGNATYLAVYMLFGVFMTLLAFVWWGRGQTAKSRSAALFYAIALILELIIIFYTATRGTILGLVGGLLIAGIIFLLFSKGNKNLRAWGIGAIVTILIVVGGFFFLKNTSFVQGNEVLTRIAGISLSEGSTRFTIWGMAWKGFVESPKTALIGWGQESFNYIFNKYYQPSLYAQEPWFDRAHNEFIDWLVAGGAVGFLLYLSLFATALWYLFRPGGVFSAIEQGLFTGLLGAYAFHDMFVFDNLMSYVLFFTVLAYIAYRSQAAQRASPMPHAGAPAPAVKSSVWHAPLSPELSAIATPAIVVVMAVVLYFVNVPGIATASDIIQGITSHPEGAQANFDYFKKAVRSAGNRGLGLQEVHEQLTQFAFQVKRLTAGDQAFQSAVAAFAESEMAAQAAATPNDARIREFFGTYLMQVGKIDDARRELLAAHTLSPDKQQILFDLGSLEANAGNLDAALAWFKQAYDLAPAFDTARLMYAAGAIRAGDRSLASSLLLPRFGTMTPDDNTILAAYLAARDYQSVLSILKARVDAGPGDYNAHVNLAAGYLQSGDKVDAIAELQKAIELNSSFQAQGQGFIDQIRAGKLP
ncbi:O-antigen ligase family protein [Candidatus Kaiserbacteria bacterium]|nr:O-antigen ligase family protein [Candidatus Kaiserbacteria bacterium]